MNRKVLAAIVILVIIVVAVVAYFMINWTIASAAVNVEPGNIQKPIGQDFVVNISVSNVKDLFGWELKLEWNPSILDFVNATEGSFLKSTGPTFFSPQYNATTSSVLVDCTLTGERAGVNGNGVLASIQLHVRGQGSCDLVLEDVKLVNSAVQSINGAVNSGHFSTSS